MWLPRARRRAGMTVVQALTQVSRVSTRVQRTHISSKRSRRSPALWMGHGGLTAADLRADEEQDGKSSKTNPCCTLTQRGARLPKSATAGSRAGTSDGAAVSRCANGAVSAQTGTRTWAGAGLASASSALRLRLSQQLQATTMHMFFCRRASKVRFALMPPRQVTILYDAFF